jgi:hypothetical protein
MNEKEKEKEKKTKVKINSFFSELFLLLLYFNLLVLLKW